VTASFGPLDPEVASALGDLALGAPTPERPTVADLPALRRRTANVPLPELPAVAAGWRDVRIPGADGAPVVVTIYSPTRASDRLPWLFWVYGGGWIYPPMYAVDPRLLRWASDLNCVVIAPTYREAPEHPFPAAHEDCWSALQWSVDHAAALGIDASRLVVGGESAGGAVAAGLALRIRDEGELACRGQVLVYPALDDRETPSRQVAGVEVWSGEMHRFALDCYLGPDRHEREVSPYAAPARATDLSGLPPTFIGVGERDVLRDEDLRYAERLRAAAVATELKVYDGAPHAFELLAPDAAISKQLNRDLDAALAGFLS
jgi:acetyl esterase/lipase